METASQIFGREAAEYQWKCMKAFEVRVSFLYFLLFSFPYHICLRQEKERLEKEAKKKQRKAEKALLTPVSATSALLTPVAVKLCNAPFEEWELVLWRKYENHIKVKIILLLCLYFYLTITMYYSPEWLGLPA